MDKCTPLDDPKTRTQIYRRSSRKSTDQACLTLTVPPGKRRDMCRLLKPLVKDVRALASMLDVVEATVDAREQGPQFDTFVPMYTVSSKELSTPALAVTLVVTEQQTAVPNAASVREKFLKFPWRYHHAIQLQTTGKLQSLLGQQEFFFLSRQLPLWSVSAAIDKSDPCVRFTLFVRRYGAMVEFYRLITGVEMESRKAGFCLFSLEIISQNLHHIGDKEESVNNIDNQTASAQELALKYCPVVNPYPLTEAYLSFPVSNLKAVLSLLPTQGRPLPHRRHLVHDPDGNALIVYERADHLADDVSIESENSVSHRFLENEQPHQSRPGLDKSSEHSSSIDSGRFSDFEASSFDLDNCPHSNYKDRDSFSHDEFSPRCVHNRTPVTQQSEPGQPVRGHVKDTASSLRICVDGYHVNQRPNSHAYKSVQPSNLGMHMAALLHESPDAYSCDTTHTYSTGSPWSAGGDDSCHRGDCNSGSSIDNTVISSDRGSNRSENFDGIPSYSHHKNSTCGCHCEGHYQKQNDSKITSQFKNSPPDQNHRLGSKVIKNVFQLNSHFAAQYYARSAATPNNLEDIETLGNSNFYIHQESDQFASYKNIDACTCKKAQNDKGTCIFRNSSYNSDVLNCARESPSCDVLKIKEQKVQIGSLEKIHVKR